MGTANTTPYISNLHDLLVHEAQDLLSAERQLSKALPAFKEMANSISLKAALERHIDQTGEQIDRLEKVLKHLKSKPGTGACQAIQGLLREADSLCSMTRQGAALDAALILICQKIEHYEMASYGSATAFADELGLTEVIQLLEESLHEEGDANELLNEIALDEANPYAMNCQRERASNHE